MESTQSNEGATKTGRSRGRFFLTALIVVIIVAVIAGMVPRLRRQSALANETRISAVTKVAVVMPISDTVGGSLVLPAEIKPWVETPIYARANGYLKSRLVDIGSAVKKGQLLAVIETPDLYQELDQARHQLAQQEAALALSKITADRYAELVKSASVSEQDNAEKQADLSLKTAGVGAARAGVSRLESLESFSRIIAPFSGTITARNSDEGELISAGSGKELFHLSQTDKLRVYVSAPQMHAAGITIGQRADLLMGAPVRQFPATVIRTAGAISADSRTLLTELEVDNTKGELLTGSFGQVKFAAMKTGNTLRLSTSTIMFGAEGPQVMLVLPDNKIEIRKVKLGRNFGPMIEIASGIEPQQRVVVNPTESLTPGATVSVVESKQNKESGQK